eukprot:2802193-Prymnesium_polylepis.1
MAQPYVLIDSDGNLHGRPDMVAFARMVRLRAPAQLSRACSGELCSPAPRASLDSAPPPFPI